MPDVYPESYDHEQVSSVVRALESAEQYTATYFQKVTVEGHGYMATGTATIAAGTQVWYYIENPSSKDYSLQIPEPALNTTVTIHLHGYFNPTVDTTTFTEENPTNLDSSVGNGFSGTGWRGDSASSTVSDTGRQFYETLVGGGKKTGGSYEASAVAEVAPGDSLLMEIDNQTTSDGEVGFELPIIEETEQLRL